MAKVPTIEMDEKTGWSEWFDDGRLIRIICCDCGLSHDFDFKVVKGKLLYRARVNNRSTAAARRNAKKKKN